MNLSRRHQFIQKGDHIHAGTCFKQCFVEITIFAKTKYFHTGTIK